MPHRMLQIHPTITMNVIICRREEATFIPKACSGFEILVVPQQNTENAEIKVPENKDKIYD